MTANGCGAATMDIDFERESSKLTAVKFTSVKLGLNYAYKLNIDFKRESSKFWRARLKDRAVDATWRLSIETVFLIKKERIADPN